MVKLFETSPISLFLLKNCKYTELTFLFHTASIYNFIYFIQDNKSKELSYLGLMNSTTQDDPSFSTNTEIYQPDEFKAMFGYQPAFSANSIKQVSIRKSTVFKRKTLTVSVGAGKVNKYYMYYQLTNSDSPQKLYACGCKGTDSSSESEIWTDILGIQGHRTTKVEDIMTHDDVAIQVNKFLTISSPETANWKVIEVEVNEYELKLEYIATLTLNSSYLIAIILHDKQDHSNALIITDFLSEN